VCLYKQAGYYRRGRHLEPRTQNIKVEEKFVGPFVHPGTSYQLALQLTLRSLLMYMVCAEVPALEPNVDIYIHAHIDTVCPMSYINMDDDTEEYRPRIVSMETTTLNFGRALLSFIKATLNC
jgi:hypothetical protein